MTTISDDLKTWIDHKTVMGPIDSSEWQAQKIGIAGPPMKTEDGWLLIYHGVSHDQLSISRANSSFQNFFP